MAHRDGLSTSGFSLILDSSVSLWVGIQSAGELVSQALGFESWSHQREPMCLLSIRKSLACARASWLTTTTIYVCMCACMHGPQQSFGSSLVGCICVSMCQSTIINTNICITRAGVQFEINTGVEIVTYAFHMNYQLPSAASVPSLELCFRQFPWCGTNGHLAASDVYEYLHLLLQHTRFKPDASHRPLIPWFPFLFVFMNSKITKLLKSRTYQRNYEGNCGHHHACRWSTTAGFCICKKLTVDGDINNTSIIWSLYLRAWAVHRHDRNKYIPHVNCF